MAAGVVVVEVVVVRGTQAAPVVTPPRAGLLRDTACSAASTVVSKVVLESTEARRRCCNKSPDARPSRRPSRGAGEVTAARRFPSNLPEGGGELGLLAFTGFMSLQGVTDGGLVEERSEHRDVMN